MLLHWFRDENNLKFVTSNWGKEEDKDESRVERRDRNKFIHHGA